jgi:hypothetical protein
MPKMHLTYFMYRSTAVRTAMLPAEATLLAVLHCSICWHAALAVPMQVAAMQRDSSTYCDEPEDAAEYTAWRSSSFSMDKQQPEIDKIMAGGWG